MDFSLQVADGFFEIKTYGDAEVEKFLDFIQALVAHEKWRPGSSVLIDHSALNAGPLTVDDISAIAYICGDYRDQIGDSKMVILVGRDLEYGLARMWSVYVNGKWDVTATILRSRDEALSWLKGA